MTLEYDCIAVLSKQMGPAAKVFLSRLCRHHLQKEADALQKDDLPKLAVLCFNGVKTALGVVAAENIKKDILSLV